MDRRIANPFYEAGSRLLRTDKVFMRNMFLEQEYGEAWLKGFALMMKGIEKYGIRIPFTPAGPFLIVWDFTHLCNLRCKHCYQNAGTTLPELSTEEAFEVVDKLSKIADVGLPALSFSGGEPLMRKDFFEVAAYASKKIPYITVATNGTLLTKDNAKRLKDVGVEYAEISLDGVSRQVHENFRRVPGCFEKTMDGMQNCIDENIDTCIATTAHKENLGEIEGIMDLADELSARFICFNYVPTGRAKRFIELDLSPEERLSVLEMVGKRMVDAYFKSKEEKDKCGRSDIGVDRFFSTCPQYSSVVKNLSRMKGETITVGSHYAATKAVENVADFLGGCGAGRLYMAVEPNGDMKPCVFFPTSEDTMIGNILKDEFEDVWNHNGFLWRLRTRKKLESYEANDRVIGCGVCEDRYICGGCRARAYYYFRGNINASDVGCIHNEELWRKVTKSIV
ncbi:MAG: radical SAM protein [Candidatus Bathyarchaeota archaeon]|nr:MAG: radical SAM protein [Candidatus Bathyarchaeota archaeon]